MTDDSKLSNADIEEAIRFLRARFVNHATTLSTSESLKILDQIEKYERILEARKSHRLKK
jgi:hypothetical protein